MCFCGRRSLRDCFVKCARGNHRAELYHITAGCIQLRMVESQSCRGRRSPRGMRGPAGSDANVRGAARWLLGHAAAEPEEYSFVVEMAVDWLYSDESQAPTLPVNQGIHRCRQIPNAGQPLPRSTNRHNWTGASGQLCGYGGERGIVLDGLLGCGDRDGSTGV